MISTDEWQEIIGTVGVLLLVTTVIVVLVWQFGATWRAKALLAREEEYRTIADKAVLLQERTERQLTEINGHLAEMQSRLQSLERILKDVE
jgi:hypothetical protein